MQLTILIGLALAIVAVAFALQNNVPVTVTFLVWRFDSALAMVVLLAAAAGALVVALLTTPSVLKMQWAAARLRRQIAALELDNGELRAYAGRIGAETAPAPTPTPLERMAPR
ncbi:MAG: lipopolysaccharide assembly protein LapA domain-containing protein [Burkholderiales bacterium]